jgi:leucyl-tRNA synthetase
MYARFFVKALADMGLVPFQEPFANLFTQGMITYQGAKMSKSKGNVISPASIVERYGADTARCYILFLGPPEQDADWSDEGIGGVHRFLARVYRLHAELDAGGAAESLGAEQLRGLSGTAGALARKTHWAIAKVGSDIERFQFNTALAALMELVNDIYRDKEELLATDEGAALVRTATATVGSLLFPFAPHLAAEAYEGATGRRVWEEPWPQADPALLESDTVTLVVQVNGKVRDSMEVPAETPEDEVKRLAIERPNVQRHLDGKSVVREVVVPGRLVNFVVK